MFATHGFGFYVFALLSLSALTCAAVLLGGWRRYVLNPPQDGPWIPALAAPFSLARTPFAGDMLDIAAEIRSVLEQMGPGAAHARVVLEMAVQPDLVVHTDPRALRALLGDLVDNAMRHAPGGRILLSAARLGGRVEIAVTDDGAGTEAAMQEAALREAAQLVALQGGTIHIEARPGEGTTVLVRLPEPMGTGRASDEAPEQHPAASPHAAQGVVLAEQSWEI